MILIFTENYRVPYYDTDITGTANPVSLLTYMGEVATLHSDDVGLNMKNLRKNNYGWMLNRWKVQIKEYPLARDFISINTWASNFMKFYANREFKIFDEEDNELLSASSVWIFLDMIRKRPIRVTEEITNRYGIEGNTLFDEFYSFNSEFTTNDGLEFRVRKSDIDYNNHVNNVKYFQWMLEVLPKDFDQVYILKEFEILYKKEVGLGSLINSSYYEKINGGQAILLHRIDEGGELRALGRTIWSKRP